MSEDSPDCCEDIDPRPSCSNGRAHDRTDQQKKRRIVMRIEFDDSDEDSSSSLDCTSDDEEVNAHNDVVLPLTSKTRNNRRKNTIKGEAYNRRQYNATNRRLRSRRPNDFNGVISDDSSSGSEVITFI